MYDDKEDNLLDQAEESPVLDNSLADFENLIDNEICCESNDNDTEEEE